MTVSSPFVMNATQAHILLRNERGPGVNQRCYSPGRRLCRFLVVVPFADITAVVVPVVAVDVAALCCTFC